jgi:flagellar motor switch protein FliN
MNDYTTDASAGAAAGDAPADDWAAAMMEQGEAETNAPPAAAGNTTDEDAYQRAKFQDLDTGSALGVTGEHNLDVILDIPVTLSMEIGRTEIPIQNLLQLNQGSVVELDRLAGEPMDVLINGTLIAHGEVVVVNEKFGIRLTDVISPSERVRKLK